MKRKRANPAHSARWWNGNYNKAVHAVKGIEATTPEEKAEARRALKAVIRKAKRDWADDHISKTNVWEVAQWRTCTKVRKRRTDVRT